MRFPVIRALFLALPVAFTACSPERKEAAAPAAAEPEAGALLVVGSITITQADLDHYLAESRGGRTDEGNRREALDELAKRARLAQAALDVGLDKDPLVRAEIARLLGNRYKELNLSPRLKEAAAAEPSEERLRELYKAGESGFRSAEKRQVAVLWLDPKGNPDRERQYVEKLTAARDWYAQDASLKAQPDQGFSILSVDYSEHQASRYKGGIVGWLEAGANTDPLSKAAAEIAFQLPEAGAVSEVISRPEGVFLVRCMAVRPAVLRTFESVAGDLTRAERTRLRQAAEDRFYSTIAEKYPIQRSE